MIEVYQDHVLAPEAHNLPSLLTVHFANSQVNIEIESQTQVIVDTVERVMEERYGAWDNRQLL